MIRIVNIEEDTETTFKEEFEKQFPIIQDCKDLEDKICIELIPEIQQNKRLQDIKAKLNQDIDDQKIIPESQEAKELQKDPFEDKD